MFTPHKKHIILVITMLLISSGVVYYMFEIRQNDIDVVEVLYSTTLEGALQSASACAVPITNLETQNIKPLDSKYVVIYSFTCPDPGLPRTEMFGYAMVEQQQHGWYVISGTAESIDDQGISAAIEFSQAGDQNFNFTYGKAINPNVTYIEADLDNGETMHDDIKNHTFVLVYTSSKNRQMSHIKEVRALDASKRIIERYPLAIPSE